LAQNVESVKMESICERFIRLIEAGDYYEAHEVFEEVWYPRRFEEKEEVRLIKGYINAAVAFELVKKGRMTPARKAWNTFLKYRPLLFSIAVEDQKMYEAVEKVLDAEHERLFGA